MKDSLTRREILAGGTAAGVVAMTTGCTTLAKSDATALPNSNRRKVLTIAHLTDIHVQPERNAQAGMAMALHHAQSHPAKPDLIMIGGDCIMDALNQNRDRVAAQWKIWEETMRNECSLPVTNCIGNHDVWGWNKGASKTTGDEPEYGKAWAMQALGLDRRYYSYDQAGWHFIVLDSTHSDGGSSYTAKLDEEQFAWLEADLKATPASTPVLILSHIPIFAACPYFDGDNEKSGNWVVPGAWMHIDARRLKDLFNRHPNVKTSLSGHIHLVDRVDYLGVKYFCNGAVCAGWWGGPYQEFYNGYGLVELFDDGSVENEFVRFDWTVSG